MESTELATLIKTRRSIRLFQDKPVPEAVLVEAVETATWAPNGGNAQNWRFFIILDKKVIKNIADAIQADMKTMMSWPEMANAGPPASRPGSPPRVDPLSTAPALIVVAAIRSPNPMVDAMAKRAKIDPKARQMFEGLQVVAGWAQSTSAAVATLMLVLHQKGLGTLWMTGGLHAKVDIEKLLKIPVGMDIVTLVPVGYPAESPLKDRKPVSEVCQIIR
jgi:nitroreductase